MTQQELLEQLQLEKDKNEEMVKKYRKMDDEDKKDGDKNDESNSNPPIWCVTRSSAINVIGHEMKSQSA